MDKKPHHLSFVSDRITPVLFSYALPIFLASLLGVLLGIPDTVIIQRSLGSSALSSLSIGASLFTLSNVFACAFPVGMFALTSRYAGEKNLLRLRQTFFVSLFLSALAAILLLVSSFFLIDPLLSFIAIYPDNLLYASARSYARLAFLSSAGMMFYSYLISFIRSLGEKIVPFLLIALFSLLSLGNDALFLQVFSWGITGCALNAILAYALVDALGFLYLYFAHPELRLHAQDCVIEKPLVKKLLGLSLPLSLQITLVSFGGVVLQGAIDGLGGEAILGLVVAGRVGSLLGLYGNGIINVLPTFMATNIGAHQPERAKKGLEQTLLWALLLDLVDVLWASFSFRPLANYYVPDLSEQAFAYARESFMFITAALILSSFIGIARFALEAVSHPSWNLWAGLLQLVSQILCAKLLVLCWGSVSIIGAGLFSEILPSLLLLVALIIEIFRSPLFHREKPKEEQDNL